MLSRLRWLLVGLTAVVYWRVLANEFINYDDAAFVYLNPHVYTGLTLENLKWAFTTLNGGVTSYQPLVWLSHQLDCQLFGLNSGAHHLTNLWFHVANTALLFTLLAKLTGKPWRSAIVTALFALHPLHVGTVAWVAERKTLVCTFCWLLTTFAYLRYVRRRTLGNYALMALLYAAALLAKPIAVSLPFTLLLLDFWPLKRYQPLKRGALGATEAESELGGGARSLRALLLEKVPLFLLTGFACLVTVVAQADLGAVKSLVEVPLSARLNNSVMACVLYLWKTIWPAALAPIYPLRQDWPWWQVGGCGLLLLSISLWALLQARNRPYLSVGWCSYLVTLLPTLGLVQVGAQGMADRYTYVPLIGIFLLLVWESAERLAGMRSSKPASGFAAVSAVTACAVTAFVNAGYWQSSFSLFRHAVRVTDNNHIAYRQLGMAYANDGKFREAAAAYKQSLRIKPDQVFTETCLAEVLFRDGDCQGAFEHFSVALKLDPKNDKAHGRLAEFFMYTQDPHFHEHGKALEQALIACQLSRYRERDPWAVLAEAYAQNHQTREAVDAAQRVLALSVGPKETKGAMALLGRVRQVALVQDEPPSP